MGRAPLLLKPSRLKGEVTLEMKLLQFLLCVGYALCVPHGYYSPNYLGFIAYPGYRQPFTAFRSHQISRNPQSQQATYVSSQPSRSFSSQQQVENQPTRSFSSNLPGRSFSSFTIGSNKINVDRYVNRALNTPLTKDNRVKAPTDLSSPSTASALAYVKGLPQDNFCGVPTEVYLQAILDGKSSEEASAEATRAYIEAYNRGERIEKGGACEAAEVAWREAERSGKDPVLQSALAFMKAYPGVREGNPCAVSGVDYVKAIISGKTHLEAGSIATTTFANAFKRFAKQGKPLKDKACKDATKAFFDAVPNKPDPANAAAFQAFADKIFNDDAPAYDPICLASLDAFIDSYNAGDDLLTANLKSARSFFKEFAKGGSRVPADSPCAAATLAYAKEIQKAPSAPNAAAMIAYITDAITREGREFDPVCAAATEAYFDAYIDGKDEAKANEAAAVAYLESLEKNPDFDINSACGKASQAYIAEFDV